MNSQWFTVLFRSPLHSKIKVNAVILRLDTTA